MGSLILAGVILGGVVWWLSRKRRRQRPIPTGSKRLPSASGQAVPTHLLRQLDRLTRDRRVSKRLVEQIALDHPHRSQRWCVEKAIYDLQRDRRS